MTLMQTQTLEQLSQAPRALTDSSGVEEVNDFRGRTEAMRKYISDAKLGLDVQNEAAELWLRAERRLGVLLAANAIKRRGPTVDPCEATLGIERTWAASRLETATRRQILRTRRLA